jgi:hypothetical protein
MERRLPKRSDSPSSACEAPYTPFRRVSEPNDDTSARPTGPPCVCIFCESDQKATEIGIRKLPPPPGFGGLGDRMGGISI